MGVVQGAKALLARLLTERGFDNGWMEVPQGFPSARFLANKVLENSTLAELPTYSPPP